MATNQKVGITLSFNADTAKAKAQLQELQNQLTKLTTNSVLNNGVSAGASGDISKAISQATQLKTILSSSTDKNGLLNLNNFNKQMKQAGLDAKSLKTSLSAMGVEGQKAFVSLTQSVANAQVTLQKTATVFDQFADSLKRTVSWQISSSLMHGFMGSIQRAFSYSEKLNESLTNIRIVTGQSTGQMAEFAKQANAAAKELGTTTTAYTDAALIFYQQGLKGSDVTERTDTVIKLANVTGQSASEVSSYMTAIWNNFDDGSKSLEHYADVITSLGAATASSSEEIAEGLEKFAAIGNTVGLSYEYATTALATVVAQTRQSAETVGTAYKTLFARIQDLEVGKTLEDGTTLGKYAQALEAIGVNIKDSTGQVKDMDDILDEMGSKWQTIDKNTQIAVAQAVAGTRQYSQLVALMDNWDKFQENLSTARNSDGSLDEQAEIYKESWKAAQKEVQTSLEDLYNSLIDDKVFIDLTKTFAKLIDMFNNFINSIGGVNTIILLLANVLTKAFGNDIAKAVGNYISNIKTFSQKNQKELQDLRKSFFEERKNLDNEMKKADPVQAFNFSINRDVTDAYMKKVQELSNAGMSVTSEFQQQYETSLSVLGVLGEQLETINKEKDALEGVQAKNKKIYENNTSKVKTNDGTVKDITDAYVNNRTAFAIKDNLDDYVSNVSKENQNQNEQEKVQDVKNYLKHLIEAVDFKGTIFDSIFNQDTLSGIINEIMNNAELNKEMIESSVEAELKENIQNDDKDSINEKLVNLEAEIDDLVKRKNALETEIGTLIDKDVNNYKKEKLSRKQRKDEQLISNKDKAEIDRLNAGDDNSEVVKKRKEIKDIEGKIAQKQGVQVSQEGRLDTVKGKIEKQTKGILSDTNRIIEGNETLITLAGQDYRNKRTQLKLEKEIVEQIEKQNNLSQANKSQNIQNTIRGVTTLAMGINSLNGALKSLTDGDLSFQAILTTITTLGFAIPNLISGFKNLGTSILSLTGTTGTYTAVLEASLAVKNSELSVDTIQSFNTKEQIIYQTSLNNILDQQITDYIKETEAKINNNAATAQEKLLYENLIAQRQKLAATQTAQSAGGKQQVSSFIAQKVASGGLTKALGVLGIAYAGISLVYNIYQKAKEEELKKSKATLDSLEEETQEINKTHEAISKISEEYENLKEKVANNEITTSGLRTEIYNLCKQYELEDVAVQTLISSYSELDSLMNSVKDKSNEEIKKSIDNETDARNQYLEKKLSSGAYAKTVKKYEDQGGITYIAENWSELQKEYAKELKSDDYDTLKSEVEKQKKNNEIYIKALLEGSENNIANSNQYLQVEEQKANELLSKGLAIDEKDAQKKVRAYFAKVGQSYALYTNKSIAKDILNEFDISSENIDGISDSQANWIIQNLQQIDISKLTEEQKNYYKDILDKILKDSNKYFEGYAKQQSGQIALNQLSTATTEGKFSKENLDILFNNSDIANYIGSRKSFEAKTFDNQMLILSNYYHEYLQKYKDNQEMLVTGIQDIEDEAVKKLESLQIDYDVEDIFASIIDNKTLEKLSEEEKTKWKEIVNQFDNDTELKEIIKGIKDRGGKFTEDDNRKILAKSNAEDSELWNQLYLSQGDNGKIADNSFLSKLFQFFDIDETKKLEDIKKNVVAGAGDIINTVVGMVDKAEQAIPDFDATIKQKTDDIARQTKDLKDLSGAYSSLTKITQEYNKQGFLSIDNIDTLLNMDPKYLAALEFENGQLMMNTSVMKEQIKAKILAAKADLYERAQSQIEAYQHNASAKAAGIAGAAMMRLAGYTDAAAQAARNAEVDWANFKKTLDGSDSYINEVVRQTDLEGAALDAMLNNLDSLVGSYGESGKASKKYFEDEFDRYWEFTKIIEKVEHELSKLEEQQDHLYGQELIDNLDKVNQKLAEQKAAYESLYEAQKVEAGELQNTLSRYGAMFDAEGYLTNYADITTSMFNQYGGVEDSEEFEEFKKALERYDTLFYNEMVDTADKAAETARKTLENNLKIFETTIQINIDKKQFEREWNKFLKDLNKNFKKLGTDFAGELSSSLEEINLFNADDGIIASALQKIQAINYEINELQNGRESKMFGSLSEAEKALEDAKREIIGYYDEVVDITDEAWDKFRDGLEDIHNGFDKLLDQFNRINDSLEYTLQLSELLYGDEAYDQRIRILNVEKEAAIAKVATLKDEIEITKHQLEIAQEMNSEIDIENAQNKLNELNGAFNTAKLNAVKLVDDIYSTTIKKITSAMKEQMDEAKTEWDNSKKQNDGIYDDTERLYQITTMQNKWNKAIADTSGLKNQQRLKDVMEEQVNSLKDKTRLSEYDIGLAERSLEVEKARIALEEAQNAKNSMKLVRNAEGNWSYQYVADQDNIADKQQNLLDKIQDKYEYIKTANEKAYEDMFSLHSDYIAKFEEIMIKYKNDDEKRQEELYKLKDLYYNEENGLMTQAIQRAAQTEKDLNLETTLYTKDLYDINKDNYETMTNSQKDIINGFKNETITSYEEMRDFGKKCNEESLESFTSMAHDMVEKFNGESPDSVRNQIEEAMEKGEIAVQEFGDGVEKVSEAAGEDLKKIDDKVNEIEKDLGTAEKAAKDFADNSASKMDILANSIEAVDSKFKGVASAIQSGIDKMDAFIITTYNAASAANNAAAAIANALSIASGGGVDYSDALIDSMLKDMEVWYNSETGELANLKDRGFNSVGWNLDSPGDGDDSYDGSTNIARITKLNDNLSSKEKSEIMQKLLLGEKAEVSKGYRGMMFATGGYTGDWDSSGKLAILHEKELVLNQEDTKNMLSAVSVVRGLVSSIGSSLFNQLANTVAGNTFTPSTVNTNIANHNDTNATNIFNINAEFPDANDVSEIKEALLSLPNLASQYVNIKTI